MGDFRDTLNLPQTDFPMRANLPKREPQRLAKWDEIGLYGKVREAREGAPKFVLHDGPPYANGHIHMGHVLNKVLKDVVLRYKTLKGFDCPFVPGWDCHGLPVEHQLFKELGKTKHEVDKLEFRKKAYQYALGFVDVQRNEFKRLGVLGRWESPYLTLSPRYEARLYVLFADLVKQGYVYRGLRPVHWCATCETALAEAEVEYYEKESPSIFVLFPSATKRDSNFLIWTTTPWTLYSNVAVAVNPDMEYVYVSDGNISFWIAKSRLRALSQILKTDFTVKTKKIGRELEGKVYKHPFLNREGKVILAEFVSGEEGTGFVHIAPGHGYEDFLVGQQYGLGIIMPLNEDGRFKNTEDLPQLEGKSIYEANDLIISLLKDSKKLLFSSKVLHSYPHCWRCKRPIVFRATYQWFLGVDKNNLRGELLRTIDKVRWIPKAGRERIYSMVESRPDWCLSRQRYWGVPIPVFYCKDCGEPVLDSELILSLAKRVEEEGSDVWFREDVEVLSGGRKCKNCGGELIKGDDILDVWFESGGSFTAVLEEEENLVFPADLYLEGSDQHRGWFQSSLIPAVAVRGIAPYKTVLTHGFVVDAQGRKMSKSLGNVISPQQVLKKYGADILRMWVCSSNYQADVRLSEDILKQVADAYRRIRNTFRYILGNLYDFDYGKDCVPFDRRFSVDRWAIDKLAQVVDKVDKFYERYEFAKVFQEIYKFCNIDMSSFYLDILKDRLYIYAPNSLERRSAQSSLYEIGISLAKILSPIIVFTADEVWEFFGFSDSVHIQLWPQGLNRISDEERKQWEILLDVRDKVLKAIEGKREEGIIGSSLEAAVLIRCSADIFSVLNIHRDHLKYLFIVSYVDIAKMEDVSVGVLEVDVKRAKGEKCMRCWNYDVCLQKSEDGIALCRRCMDVIQILSKGGMNNA